eukprot:scaffold97482_cov35-Attheya_sp.AAC.1
MHESHDSSLHSASIMRPNILLQETADIADHRNLKDSADIQLLNPCPHVSEPQSDQYYNLQKEDDGQLSCNVNDKEETTQSSTEHDHTTFLLNNEAKETYLSWDDMFQRLIEFRNVHGHTQVPQRSGALGKWVEQQRQEFHLLNQGKRSSLTQSRFLKLEYIGFFSRPTPCWDSRFQEL